MQIASGRRERAVPHHRLDRHEVHASSSQQRPVRVSQVVEAQRPQTCSVASLLEPSTKSRPVEMSSERIAEHKLGFAYDVLPFAQTIQGRCSLGWQRNATDTPLFVDDSMPSLIARLIVSA